VPIEPEALTAATPVLRAVKRLTVNDLGAAGDLLACQISTDPHRLERQAAREYYLGDTAPGAATKAFVRECGRLIDLAQTNWDRAQRRLKDEAAR
jgi:hypothetical protein